MRTVFMPLPIRLPLLLPLLLPMLLLMLLPGPRLAALELAGPPPKAGPVMPGLVLDQCTCDGLVRTWLRFLPVHHDARKACPLIMVLHGGGGSAEGMTTLTEHGFEQLAETSDAVVIYPEAVETNWHDDREGLDTAAVRRHIDDVAFLRAAIRTTGQETAIDPQRIYATGISNGAMLCYRLAREAPEIAAVAAVAGLLPSDARSLPWTNPVSVLVIQGTEDPLMPINGGPIGSAANPRGEVLSLAETTHFLLAQDGLDDNPQDVPLPAAADNHDLTSCRCQVYGQIGTSVAIYTVVGGGHTWPGGRQYLPEPLVGRTSHSFDACRAIWEFFMRHPHR